MELFYREKGKADLPPLILLHGLWGASDNWLPVAGELSEDFHVFLPDLRNHGFSPHHAVHDYRALSGDLRDFVRQLKLTESPFWVGHSMGGKALMAFLLEHPEAVAGAAVVDIAPRTYPVEEMHLRLFRFLTAHPLLEGYTRPALLDLIRQAFPEQELQQLLLKDIVRRGSGYAWKIGVEGLLANQEALRGWPQMNGSCPAPLLFIQGETSAYLQPGDRMIIRQLFPAASFTVIPGAGHWIHATHPGELAAVVAAFFQKLRVEAVERKSCIFAENECHETD